MNHQPASTSTLAPIIFIGILLVVLFCIRHITRAKKRFMGELAAELNLHVLEKEPEIPNVKWLSWITKPAQISGYFGKHAVLIHHFNRGKQTYHGFIIALKRKSSFRLQINSNTINGKLDIGIGIKRVTTGDKEMDKRLIIRSNDPDLANVIVGTPEIRQALLSTFGSSKIQGCLESKDCAIQYARPGSLRTEERKKNILTLVNLGETLAVALDTAAEISVK